MLRTACSFGLFASALFAQSPLTTTLSGGGWLLPGSTMYFDLVVNTQVVITQVDVVAGPGATAAGTIEVRIATTAPTFVGPHTNPLAWTLGGTGNCVAAGPSPSSCPISPFLLAPGTYGIAVVYNGIYPYYEVGNGSPVPGSGNNQTYSTAELTLLAGGGGPGPAGSGITAIPAVFCGRIHYSVGAPGVAVQASYGSGCYQRIGSFYESFASSAAFDLSNTAISMFATGFGYTVLPGVSPFMPPSPNAQVLPFVNNFEWTVGLSAPFPHDHETTSTLVVGSDGYVAVASGNAVGPVPSAAVMLAAPKTAWWNWHDYGFPISSGGHVKFEENGSLACITWDGVLNAGGSGAAHANTFQFQFDTTTGDVHLVFQTMSALGNARLVGFSPGGPSIDPGSVDLSATLPSGFVLPDEMPLTLAASARPLLGTSIALVTSHASAPGFGVNFLSLVEIPAPGLALGFLGAPGCAALVDVNAGVGNVISNVAVPAMSIVLPIPNNLGLVGVQVCSQSAWLDPLANPFGVLTSNGVRLLLGNL